MHRHGVGATHRGKPVLVLLGETAATVIDRTTSAVLATNTLDPPHTPTGATTTESPTDGRAL